MHLTLDLIWIVCDIIVIHQNQNQKVKSLLPFELNIHYTFEFPIGLRPSVHVATVCNKTGLILEH